MKRMISTDDVLSIISNIIDEVDLFGLDPKDAETTCNYIAGIVDVKHTLIKWIEEGGDRNA